jgi:hypothetical protein
MSNARAASSPRRGGPFPFRGTACRLVAAWRSAAWPSQTLDRRRELPASSVQAMASRSARSPADLANQRKMVRQPSWKLMLPLVVARN